MSRTRPPGASRFGEAQAAALACGSSAHPAQASFPEKSHAHAAAKRIGTRNGEARWIIFLE